MRKLSKEIKDKVVCLGCGWVGDGIADLNDGACPECGYENGAPPWRLPTLQEILDSSEETELVNVRLDLFLKTLFGLMELNYEQEAEVPDSGG